jgi:hypothetical protein
MTGIAEVGNRSGGGATGLRKYHTSTAAAFDTRGSVVIPNVAKRSEESLIKHCIPIIISYDS